MPSPETERFIEASEALLLMATVAEKLPTAFGVNAMLMGALCPAVRIIGRLVAVSAKYFVENEMLLMVTDSGPEFVTVAERVLLVPEVTLPKLRLELARESVLVCC